MNPGPKAGDLGSDIGFPWSFLKLGSDLYDSPYANLFDNLDLGTLPLPEVLYKAQRGIIVPV